MAGPLIFAALVGLSTSLNLGEPFLAPGGAIVLTTGQTVIAARYMPVPKVATGAGYIVKLGGDTRIVGPVRAGLEYTLRNGGPWTKHVLRGQAGLGWRGVSVLYSRDLYVAGGRNFQSAVILRAFGVARGRARIAIWTDLALHRYHDTELRRSPVRWGLAQELLIGWAWGTGTGPRTETRPRTRTGG